jgi:predicted nucleic acid-binding protein
MNDRFFLDTNIFVYCFDEAAPAKAQRARELVREAILTRKGIVSFQVVQEFLNVALRRFSRPMNIAEAEQYLATIFRPLLAIHSSASLYMAALQLTEKFHFSWYDSLIVAAATEGQCKILYSEDLQHGQQLGQIQVQNPFL